MLLAVFVRVANTIHMSKVTTESTKTVRIIETINAMSAALLSRGITTEYIDMAKDEILSDVEL